MVLLNLMGLLRWWLGKRLFIITNYTLIAQNPSSSCRLQLTRQESGRIYDDFLRLLFLHAHREASALVNDIPEESGQFRFLRAACFTNIKGSVGLILAKTLAMRISIPFDLSSRPFIPLPSCIRSRRPTTLLVPFLVFSPRRSA